MNDKEKIMDYKFEKVVFTGDIPQCPYCKKPTQRTGNSGPVTTAYYPPVYDENGVNINDNRNSFREHWQCYECGNSYDTTGSLKERYYLPEKREELIIHSAEVKTYQNVPRATTQTIIQEEIEKTSMGVFCACGQLIYAVNREFLKDDKQSMKDMNMYMQKGYRIESVSKEQVKKLHGFCSCKSIAKSEKK